MRNRSIPPRQGHGKGSSRCRKLLCLEPHMGLSRAIKAGVKNKSTTRLKWEGRNDHRIIES